MLRALAALTAVLLFGLPALAEEAILRFDATVVVRPDGVLDVTEEITVRAEGDRIRQGIFRDFPLVFVDDAGNRHRVTFDLVEVTKNGAPEPHHTNRNSDGIRIYAGKEGVFLATPGTYTYRLRYETDRQIRFLPGHTELFWNVTGNEWAFPIDTVTARVVLPDGGAPVRWTAYTGRYGERGTDFRGEVLGDNSLSVSTTRRLAAGEGLSVVVEIPDGLVAPPSGTRQLYYDFLDNRRFVFGGLGLFGVFLFYFTAWNAVGRDPPKGTIIPLFHPPEGISPALAAYVRNFGWSGGWREFTAAAISLAVKGLLTFEDADGTIVLKRAAGQGADGAALPDGERTILDWVRGQGGSVRIDRANGPAVAKAFTAFKRAVEGENRTRFFNRNSGYFALGVALTVVAIILVLVFGDVSPEEAGLLFAFAVAGTILGALLVPLIRAILGRRRPTSIVAVVVNVAIVLIVGGMIVSMTTTVAQGLPDDFATSAASAILRNSFPFALVAGFAALNGLFYYLLRAPTAAGRAIMDRIEGLELYIRTAETNRLNLAGAPQLDTKQFERLLPYAIALDAEKPWSDAFASAFARSHPTETVEQSYAPAWHGGRNWGSRGFGAAVASAVSAAQGSFASAIPPPKSSSSGFSGGGGGGSGGGGGGGGGGGW